VTKAKLKTMSCKAVIVCFLLAVVTVPSFFTAMRKTFTDVVILNGRVIDPESELDAVLIWAFLMRHQAITVVPERSYSNRCQRDGCVARLIDLHQHGQTEENYRFKVMDGVTTALNWKLAPEMWTVWYAERQGRATINYGVSIGHLAARMAAMHDPVEFLPPARRHAEPLLTLNSRHESASRTWSGRGVQCSRIWHPSSAASFAWEILEMFPRCGALRTSCHVRRCAFMSAISASVAALRAARGLAGTQPDRASQHPGRQVTNANTVVDRSSSLPFGVPTVHISGANFQFQSRCNPVHYLKR